LFTPTPGNIYFEISTVQSWDNKYTKKSVIMPDNKILISDQRLAI
jgi:hypothetical protein